MTLNNYLKKQFVLQNINRFFNEVLVESKLQGYNQQLENIDKLLQQKFDNCPFLSRTYKAVIEFDIANNLSIAVYENDNIFLSLTFNFNEYENKKQKVLPQPFVE